MATVFLVDDDIEVTNSMGANLNSDHQVYCFNSVTDAMAKIDSGTCPEVIITDLRMPEKDGMEMLREIRDKHVDSRVIMASGHLDKQDTIEATNLGVFGILEKPFTTKQLKQMVDHAAHKSDDQLMLVEEIKKCQKIIVTLEELNKIFFQRIVWAENICMDSQRGLFDKSDDVIKHQEFVTEERRLNNRLSALRAHDVLERF